MALIVVGKVQSSVGLKWKRPLDTANAYEKESGSRIYSIYILQ